LKKDAEASFFIVVPGFYRSGLDHKKNGGIEPPFFVFSSDVTCRCAPG